MAYRGLRNNMEAEEKKRLETEWFNKHRENRNNIDKTYIDILSDKPMFEKIGPAMAPAGPNADFPRT